MENKSVKEYTKLEQYQYIQQHYNDTLKQTNLRKKIAKELGITESKSYAMIQTILHTRGVPCSNSHVAKKDISIAKMVFAKREEEQPSNQLRKIPETKELSMFKQNIDSLTLAISDIIMEKCPFFDKNQVIERVEKLLSYMIKNRCVVPQIIFDNINIVLSAAFYTSSLFHDGEEAKILIKFGENKPKEIFFTAIWTEKGIYKLGIKSFFQIETNESMITKIIAFLRAKPDKIHEVVNILK